MTFFQQYTIEEAGFGTQTIRVVVSDKVSDLYLSDELCDYECDCINIDTTKQTLTLADNKYGIDELKFNINGAATINSDGNKYVNAFLLEANNLTKSRFIAVFFNPVFTGTQPDDLIATAQFRGKVSNIISGVDLDWKNAIYSGAINPLREFDFSAYSIDFGILEKIKLTEKITLENDEKINGVYPRISPTEVGAIFESRLAYQGKAGTTNSAWFYSHFHKLGSLYRVLQLMFDKATIILADIYPDQDITVTLLESTLTLKTQPTGYGLTVDPARNISIFVPQIVIDNSMPTSYAVDKKIILTIKEGADTEVADDIESPIFINERMFDENLNVVDIEWAKNKALSERDMCFKQYDNLAKLLFDIARSFGCFLKMNLTGTNNIEVQFVSRDSYVQSEATQLIDSTDAKIDLSGNNNEGKQTTYYGVANGLTSDGNDMIESKDIIFIRSTDDNEFKNNFEGEKSNKFIEIENKIIELKSVKDIDIKRLLFTTSQPIEYHRYKPDIAQSNPSWLQYSAFTYIHNLCFQPMNIVHSPENYEAPIPPFTFVQSLSERLHTGIYIRVKKTNMAHPSGLNADFYNVLTDDNLYCPANYIHIKYDGAEESFPTLTDYINFIMAIDEYYYTQEYAITVPYWSGFKKGANTNWKQLQLGSKVALTWNVISYNGTTFVEAPVTKTFIVNEIERSYKSPETKIKLHYDGRFNYAESTSAAEVVEQNQGIPITNLSLENIKTGIAGETIAAGDAVMRYSDGKLYRGIPYHDFYGKIIGIAKNPVAVDETCYVQIAGEVVNMNYDFTGHIGEYVYCRGSILPTLNISVNCLTAETGDEDIKWILGKIETVNTFVLGIMEIPYGGHYPEPPAP